MKVIKKENVKDWNYKITCEKCNSELEVEAKDLTHTRYDGDYRESGYDSYHAYCAVCSGQLIVPSNSIPKLIQVETKSRAAPRIFNGRD